MPRPYYKERAASAEKAKDHLLRAAAALTEGCSRDNLAFALLEGAMGLMRIADADPNCEALDKIVGILRELKERDDACKGTANH